jgi:hypothetical protein
MLSTTLDLGVAQADAFLSGLALITCAYAAVFANPKRRVRYAATASLCLIYVIGYVFLLLDFPPRVVEWSRYMRGVSLVSWVLVWMWPAIQDVRIYRSAKRSAKDLQAKVNERLGDVA